MNNISDTTGALETESYTTINLGDMAEKTSGAWPKGWYPAEIIEGYTAGSHQFLSGSSLSKKGDSFNFRLCFRTKNGDAVRTMFSSVNYRAVDFSQERIDTVLRLRKEFAGVRGKWPGFESEQRSSLALGQLGQIQNATGCAVQINSEDGQIMLAPFLGKPLFIRLTIDDETGYNEITGYSKYENGVVSKKRK